MSESETKRKWRRIHGLQWPWHPQQVTAWSILLYFIIFTFCAIIPNFNSGAQLILTISHALLFLSHLFTHAVAELLDPSDPELRAKSAKRPVPEFDRNKHAHVIENGRCHLCNITISSQRTKHCSACNKCVHVFDHHCKWLNQCIGERNYKWFACSVATAILMALSFIVMALTIIGFYYSKFFSFKMKKLKNYQLLLQMTIWVCYIPGKILEIRQSMVQKNLLYFLYLCQSKLSCRWPSCPSFWPLWPLRSCCI